MSYALLRWAWCASVNATEKLVLLALADCCNGHHDSNACWPSMAHMQAMTGLSARTLQRAFNGLEARGLISRTFGHGKETTTYTLHAVDPRQNVTPTPVRMTPHPRQVDASPPSICRPTPVNLTPVPGTLSGSDREAEREGGHTAPAKGVLSQATIPNWAEICAELRPDLEPLPGWTGFSAYHMGQAHTADAWGRKWRMWCSREWKNRKTLSKIVSCDKPGSFFNEDQDAIPGDYEVSHAD